MRARRDDPSFDGIEWRLGAHDDAWLSLAHAKLTTEMARGCPVRAIQASPIKDVGRIVFADGTVLLARSHHRGVLTELSFEAAQHSVLIRGVERSAHHLEAIIDAGTGRLVTVSIVGIDQPD